MKNENCVLGCKHFTGGEIKHNQSCIHYKESFSKIYDDLHTSYGKSIVDIIHYRKDLKMARSIIITMVFILLMAVVALWVVYGTRYDLGYKEGQLDSIESIKE